MRHRWVLPTVLALLVVVVGGGVLWWRSAHLSDLERAAALAPADTQRITWTDWAGVRAELGSRVDGSSGSADLAAFLADAHEADLSPMSALVSSAEAMQTSYGFSPATVQWELLAQSTKGTAVLMRLPDDTDFDQLAETLERLGYQPPEEDTGVWQGGGDLLPRIGSLTPELQYLALDEDEGLVVGSDTETYARKTIGSVTGETDGFEGLGEVLAASGEPLAAAVYDGEVVCSRLSMGDADPSAQAEADDLLAAAGEVTPLTGFAMARRADGGVQVAMSFEDEDEARLNADTRARLASGPAPGQGGDFGDRFRLGQVAADGAVVTMQLEPRSGTYVLSDLSTGPVLFATC